MELLERVLTDEDVELPQFPIVCVQHMGLDVCHENKTNHNLYLSFRVLDTDKSIKIYGLTTENFESYAIMLANEKRLEPKNYQFVIEKRTELLEYNIPISKSSRIHLLFVKKTPFKVNLNLKIQEKWEQKQSNIGILPNIPLADNRLSKVIRELINTSEKSLKIISPYTDLHLMEELSSAINRNVDVKLIIKNEKDNNTHSTKQAFPHLQKLLKQNLKSHDNVHARMLICDDEEAVVMSSDINQDSMQNLINCGIHVTDSVAITELVDFFEKIWSSSKNTSKNV